MTATESKTKQPVSHFISAVDPFFMKFGITNGAKTPIARAYVNAYVQCWTRQADGFNGTPTFTRKQAYVFFNSDEYLQECVNAGVTEGSEIGKRASLDARWGDEPVKMREAKAKRKTAPASTTPVAQPPAAPAVDTTADPEATAFAANALVNEAAIIISEPVAPVSETLLADAPQHQAKQIRREKLAKQMADAIAA